jgi:hypothetical protein
LHGVSELFHLKTGNWTEYRVGLWIKMVAFFSTDSGIPERTCIVSGDNFSVSSQKFLLEFGIPLNKSELRGSSAFG